MQFYALKGNIPLLAAHAEKQRDYLCPECRGVVRLRKGTLRQPHFYHFRSSSRCRQNGKSAAHLQLQWAIFSLFPSGQSHMERPFPEISRIADVTWETEKIVFEVQCSPLSLREAEQRCLDYKSVGFTPIWILHDRQFNGRKISASEELLRKVGAYYTNFDEKGYGEIYDQFDICKSGRRIFQGPSLQVDLKNRLFFSGALDTNLPKTLTDRLKSWPFYFAGDLFARFTAKRNPLLLEMEKKFLQKKETSWLTKVKQFYLTFFRPLLEKACK